MGFAVLHIQKPKGNDARTTAHIERTVQPGNADSERKHLNEEFIKFPKGVENRTQAIQYRIEHANISRKIKDTQVRALQVMLSGTSEDMKRIQNLGKLDEWCKDNIEWLQGTFGKDNVVSAVLHMDEKTPHIHATVVPIVQGERRKAKAEEDNGKKKYRKKPKDTVRLCADDIMTRDNLKLYQNSYAEKMARYGLERGIKGSDARHISTPQFYRDLYAKNEDLKEDIEILQEQKEEVSEKIWDLYDRKDEAREKFLDMDEYVRRKEKELVDMEIRLQRLKQDYELYEAQEDLNTLLEVFPKMAESLRITQYCQSIGLAVDTIKKLFTGKAVSYSGKLRSPEHDRDFSVQDAKLQLYKEKDKPDKIHLSFNGENIVDWFQQKYQAMKQAVEQRYRPKKMSNMEKNNGIKM